MRIRITHLMAAGLMACAVFACQQPESEKEPQVLEVKVKENPNALESSIEVTVNCDLHWTAQVKDSSWGSVEVTEVKDGTGGTFVFKMGVNKSEDARENTLIVKAGKGTLEKKITQGGLGTLFSPRSITLVGKGQVELSFPTPSAWTAKVSPESESWLRLSPEYGSKGTARITVQAKDANENVGGREGSLQVTVDGDTFDIPVKQGQTDVILTENTQLEFEYEPQEFSVSTRYNVDYQVEVTESWITHEKTKAPLNEGVERFTVSENNTFQVRTAEIRFTGGNAEPLVLTVTQNCQDPILNVFEPGFYGINGQNYIKGAEGWNQSSVLVSASGGRRYRLLNSKELTHVDVTGDLLDSAKPGDNLSLHVTVKAKSHTRLIKSYSVVLLQEQDGLAWYKESDNTYFILEK